jgi:geranylgeranyl pyrophosphate synthase
MIQSQVQMTIEAHTLYTKLPLVREVLTQKWAHSHYIHGSVAYDAGVLAGHSEQLSIAVATALEFVWAGILIYDDILDADEVRYHTASAWKKAGYAQAMSESFEAMFASPLLIDETAIGLRLHMDTHETIQAMRSINEIALSAPLWSMEATYQQLGALSVFACTWPAHTAQARASAQFETLAGQLINDCNDCFGKKAQRRGYSDLRNKQATLLLGVLNSVYHRDDFAVAIAHATEADLPKIATDIQACIAANPVYIYQVFDAWMDQAVADVEALQMPTEYRSWMSQRVKNNYTEWSKKLRYLVENPHREVGQTHA